jgi:predicted MFS family arabinose efflux permease
MVAVIQIAITLGAAAGRMLFDAFGYDVAFLGGALMLVGSALVGAADARISHPDPKGAKHDPLSQRHPRLASGPC